MSWFLDQLFKSIEEEVPKGNSTSGPLFISSSSSSCSPPKTEGGKGKRLPGAPLFARTSEGRGGVEVIHRRCSRFHYRRSRSRMVGPARPLFVLFGSSIVQYSFGHGGWGATLAEIYARKVDVVLRGYAGWNSRRALQVINKIFPKDASVQPSLIIVYFGGNDSTEPHPSGLGPHVPLPEYITNMREIAEHLMSLSDKNHRTRIIFLSCPPLNEEQLLKNLSPAVSPLVRTNELCRIYSDACINLCRELKLEVIDLWTAIQSRDDWQTACFTDGIHFTKEGSDIVVEEILKVLKEANWEPSLHWRSLPAEFAEDSPYDIVAADGKTTINVSNLNIHWEKQWD